MFFALITISTMHTPANQIHRKRSKQTEQQPHRPVRCGIPPIDSNFFWFFMSSGGLVRIAPLSRTGDTLLIIRVVYPQNRTAVLNGLSSLQVLLHHKCIFKLKWTEKLACCCWSIVCYQINDICQRQTYKPPNRWRIRADSSTYHNQARTHSSSIISKR